MDNIEDTIAAIATANGEGGIAIVRLSGPESLKILKNVFRPSGKKELYKPCRMMYGFVTDEEEKELDEAMAVYFAAPGSYTRQDVCEIHTHGGAVSRYVLERVVKAGARPARRGEFTYRAFMNGRIDIGRAEAVMSLIRAGSEQAVRSSVHQLKYGVSSRIGACGERIKQLLTLIDAAVDFPDEIDETVTEKHVRQEAKAVASELAACADRRYARLMSEGASVVIAGKPNVGKSSLMNALLGSSRSIVTDIPGTTRDVINESVSIKGIRITLTDTAGIRDTGDRIEKIGVDRAEDSIKSADCVILVMDGSAEPTEEDRYLLSQRDERYLLVINKSDLDSYDPARFPNPDLEISALNQNGIRELTDRIYDRVSAGEDDERLLSLRHIECAERAEKALERLTETPAGTYLDLLRSDLTEALDAIGEITGENMTESVIDSIFERFCVGK